MKDGERRLRGAIRKARQVAIGKTAEEHRPQPVNLEPTTAFEATVIARLRQLEADVAELRALNQWIVRLIIGGIVGAAIEILTG